MRTHFLSTPLLICSLLFSSSLFLSSFLPSLIWTSPFLSLLLSWSSPSSLFLSPYSSLENYVQESSSEVLHRSRLLWDSDPWGHPPKCEKKYHSSLVFSSHVLYCSVLSYHFLNFLVLSCFVELPCLVFCIVVWSCLVLSCLVLSCLVLSCLVLCFVLFHSRT